MTLTPSQQYLQVYYSDFPNLSSSNWTATSCPDRKYNCIAWAASDSKRWWEPNRPEAYWPPNAPSAWTVNAVVAAFISIGYEVCNSGDVSLGYSKIAIYADHKGVPTHAAKQLKDGYWSSKLGKGHDIRHEFRALDGLKYGTATVIMERPKNIFGPIVRWIVNHLHN